jgi:hypothetical protein
MDNTPLDQNLLDDMFEDLGLDLLPPEEREEVVAHIGEVIFEGVMLRTVQALDDTKKEELTALFDASSSDPENEEKHNAIQAFIETNVPDFDKYLAAEIEALKNAPQDVFVGN